MVLNAPPERCKLARAEKSDQRKDLQEYFIAKCGLLRRLINSFEEGRRWEVRVATNLLARMGGKVLEGEMNATRSSLSPNDDKEVTIESLEDNP